MDIIFILTWWLYSLEKHGFYKKYIPSLLKILFTVLSEGYILKI